MTGIMRLTVVASFRCVCPRSGAGSWAVSAFRLFESGDLSCQIMARSGFITGGLRIGQIDLRAFQETLQYLGSAGAVVRFRHEAILLPDGACVGIVLVRLCAE